MDYDAIKLRTVNSEISKLGQGGELELCTRCVRNGLRMSSLPKVTPQPLQASWNIHQK